MSSLRFYASIIKKEWCDRLGQCNSMINIPICTQVQHLSKTYTLAQTSAVTVSVKDMDDVGDVAGEIGGIMAQNLVVDDYKESGLYKY